MKLIRKVWIEGYRSIANEEMSQIGDHTVFIGKNSSGKSNTLRALSLFLNDPSSMDYDVDFEHDLYYRPSRRRKKLIKIRVEFNLPRQFVFRQGVTYLKNLGTNFIIEKIWELDNHHNIVMKPRVTDILGNEIGAEREANDFLSLVKFRYIATRSSPSDIFDEEASEISSAFYKRIRSSKSASNILDELNKSSRRILESPSKALRKSGAPIQNPSIVTQKSLLDMLSLSGFQATGLNGVVVRDRNWGSGHQEFFLLNLLKEIDTDYSRQFGWKQACVWALEEPESSLHYDLQAGLARQLMSWATDAANRLQIFTSTHSPVIAMSGDEGYFVELGNMSTELRSHSIPEVVALATKGGVSGYTHPVLMFPFNSVVLVEGQIDARVLNHVSRTIGYTSLNFVCLPQLASGSHGGFSNITGYISENQALIHRRARDAPFVILGDWDISDQELIKAQNAYGASGDRYVLRASVDDANEMLGPSFRGIERYYPCEAIMGGHDQGILTVGFPKSGNGPWSVSKDQLSMKCKMALMNIVLSYQGGDQLRYLSKTVKAVAKAASLLPVT